MDTDEHGCGERKGFTMKRTESTKEERCETPVRIVSSVGAGSRTKAGRNYRLKKFPNANMKMMITK